MEKTKTFRFKAKIDLIGINPFVFVPEKILASVFSQAGKDKGPIPVRGVLNEKPFTQTLVKFAGHWRLYINTAMLRDSPRRIGELAHVELAFDPVARKTPFPRQLKAALKNDANATKVFTSLPPSRQKEIVRYIANLKSEEAIERNVVRAIDFLNGRCSFAGRKKPKD